MAAMVTKTNEIRLTPLPGGRATTWPRRMTAAWETADQPEEYDHIDITICHQYKKLSFDSQYNELLRNKVAKY